MAMTSEPVILFTQAGCHDSSLVRQWLQQRHVLYVEKNVSGDAVAASELLAIGIFATPLLLAGDTRIFGFREDEMKRVLDK